MDNHGGGQFVRGFTAFSTAVWILVAAGVEAQTREWTDIGLVSINFGYQTGDRSFRQGLSSPQFDEVAEYSIDHGSSAGPLVDVSGGVRMWRSLAAGFGFTSFKVSSTVDGTGTVPHPLFFDRPRNIAFRQSVGDHTQLGFHFQALYLIPLTDRVDVSIFGGPSVFRVEQDLVTAVGTTEANAPFDSVSVSDVETLGVTETGFGGHVGADVTYMFTERWGGGFFVRYAGGSVDVPVEGGTASLDVGGFQTGGGLRVRF